MRVGGEGDPFRFFALVFFSTCVLALCADPEERARFFVGPETGVVAGPEGGREDAPVVAGVVGAVEVEGAASAVEPLSTIEGSGRSGFTRLVALSRAAGVGVVVVPLLIF